MLMIFVYMLGSCRTLPKNNICKKLASSSGMRVCLNYKLHRISYKLVPHIDNLKKEVVDSEAEPTQTSCHELSQLLYWDSWRKQQQQSKEVWQQAGGHVHS
jgi:hypothetical protein